METIRRKRRSLIIALILSLLFHASFVVYLVLQKTDYLHPAPILTPEEELQQKINREEQWAETKARASNFGAPVLFEDAPAFAEASPFAKASEDTSEDMTADKPKIDAQPEDKQEEHTETKAPELERSIDIPDPKEITTIEQVINVAHLKSPSCARPEPVEGCPRALEDTLQQVQGERKKTKKSQRTTPQPAQRQPATPSPKQLPTLAQLTQGFLHQAKDEGNHTIHMLGQRNGLPTDEQMKYERYLQKLNWCLQNSFTINNSRYPQSERVETEVQLFLALDKDGRIKQLNVAKSSGSKQLDQFVLFVFRDASSSFPPVPQYLPHNPFTIMYIVMLNSANNNFRVYRR